MRSIATTSKPPIDVESAPKLSFKGYYSNDI